MPTTTLTPTPYQTVLDTDGNPLPGALIYTYAAGTTTPATTYTDDTGTVANANPIVADAAGRWTAYLTPGIAYKFVVKTAGGVTVNTVDGIQGVQTVDNVVTLEGRAGEAFAAGKIVYLSNGSGGRIAGRWYLASRSNAYSSTDPLIGYAINGSGGLGNIFTVAIAGGSIAGTYASGATYYVGTSGDAVSLGGLPTFSTNLRVVGTGYGTGLNFDPRNSTQALGIYGTFQVGNQSSSNVGTYDGTLRVTVGNGAGGIGAMAIQSGTNTTTGSAYDLAFTSMGGAAEWMRITSIGRVGIGTNAPLNKLHVVGDNCVILADASTGYGGFLAQSAGATDAYMFFRNATNGEQARITAQDGNILHFSTGNSVTDRMVIASSGYVGIGTGAPPNPLSVDGPSTPLYLRHSGSTAGKYWTVGPASSNNFSVFNNTSTGMYIVDGATAWTASSDERLKDILEPIADGASKVDALRAVIGKFKSDPDNTRRAFLIAQDVQQVLPEAVTTDDNGFLGVAYTDVIPLLVSAIKELKARVEALEQANG